MTENNLRTETTVSGGEHISAASDAVKLQALTTLALGEEVTTFALGEEGGSTFAFGEEATTEAIGEEQPTANDGENPSPTDFSRLGGPFGAY